MVPTPTPIRSLLSVWSGGVPFMADETEGDLVELSIIGNLEFDDFLKSVAAIRQKRIRAAQA
jgi:hypothetical protein